MRNRFENISNEKLLSTFIERIKHDHYCPLCDHADRYWPTRLEIETEILNRMEDVGLEDRT